jgi:hypothetical protein
MGLACVGLVCTEAVCYDGNGLPKGTSCTEDSDCSRGLWCKGGAAMQIGKCADCPADCKNKGDGRCHACNNDEAKMACGAADTGTKAKCAAEAVVEAGKKAAAYMASAFDCLGLGTLTDCAASTAKSISSCATGGSCVLKIGYPTCSSLTTKTIWTGEVGVESRNLGNGSYPLMSPGDGDSPATILNDSNTVRRLTKELSAHIKANPQAVFRETFKLDDNSRFGDKDSSRVLAGAQSATYKLKKASCISGRNIIKYPGQTVDRCKAKCNSNSKCLAFEFGVAYGGGGGYKAGDCNLQDATYAGVECDGKHYNLDLYYTGANKRHVLSLLLLLLPGCIIIIILLLLLYYYYYYYYHSKSLVVCICILRVLW